MATSEIASLKRRDFFGQIGNAISGIANAIFGQRPGVQAPAAAPAPAAPAPAPAAPAPPKVATPAAPQPQQQQQSQQQTTQQQQQQQQQQQTAQQQAAAAQQQQTTAQAQAQAQAQAATQAQPAATADAQQQAQQQQQGQSTAAGNTSQATATTAAGAGSTAHSGSATATPSATLSTPTAGHDGDNTAAGVAAGMVQATNADSTGSVLNKVVPTGTSSHNAIDASNSASPSGPGSSPSIGKIVGPIAAVVIISAIIAIIVFFLVRRRRRRDSDFFCGEKPTGVVGTSFRSRIKRERAYSIPESIWQEPATAVQYAFISAKPKKTWVTARSTATKESEEDELPIILDPQQTGSVPEMAHFRDPFAKRMSKSTVGPVSPLSSRFSADATSVTISLPERLLEMIGRSPLDRSESLVRPKTSQEPLPPPPMVLPPAPPTPAPSTIQGRRSSSATRLSSATMRRPGSAGASKSLTRMMRDDAGAARKSNANSLANVSTGGSKSMTSTMRTGRRKKRSSRLSLSSAGSDSDEDLGREHRVTNLV